MRRAPRHIQPVVTGLLGRISAPLADGRLDHDRRVQRAVGILIARIAAMPPYLGVPMTVLTVMFDWAGVLRTGRRFSAQSIDQQNAQIGSWKSSKMELMRNFIQFYEKMGTFIYMACLETPEK